MFYVIAKRPIKNSIGDITAIAHEETESGPFDTRTEAARFCIGLAKTGQAFETRIEERNGDALEMCLAAHSALDKELFDFPDVVGTEHLQNARDALSDAVSELMEHNRKQEKRDEVKNEDHD